MKKNQRFYYKIPFPYSVMDGLTDRQSKLERFFDIKVELKSYK